MTNDSRLRNMHSPFDLHKPIAVGSDHAGFKYKEDLISFIEGIGLAFYDFGTHVQEPSKNKDFISLVVNAVENKQASFGVLIDSSANEVAICANKFSGIRAAVCWGEELSKLSRENNDANIICIPAFFVREGDAERMLHIFMTTDFTHS